MMELLVFLVLLFGLFGVILTQYVAQYRSAYNIWVQEIVYNKDFIPLNGNGTKCEICSTIEAYSRELCEMHDIITVMLVLISATLTVVFLACIAKLRLIGFFVYTDYSSFWNNWGHFDPNTKFEILLTFSCIGLTLLIFIAIPVLLHMLKILGQAKKDAIDEKLFSVWWKHKCHRHKTKEYYESGQPKQMYKKLAIRILHEEDVKDATKEDKELVKKLFPSMFRNYS